jgi:hypothetical protein
MLTALNIVLLVLNAAFLGVGIYLSSYLKTKAKNLATREDFEGLRQQTASLTQTTREIEAKISSEVWDRQKHWELKREVLFEMGRQINTAVDTLKRLDNLLQTKTKNPKADQSVWDQMKIVENEKWFEISNLLSESHLFVGVSCGPKAIEALEGFLYIIRTMVGNIYKGDTNCFRANAGKLNDAQEQIRTAIREELRFNITSQSTESSVAPTPAKQAPAAKP